MSRNRILLLEVEKTVRDANAAIQAYDSRWQDLRELNVAVSAAEADVQAATDTAKPAVKGKKNAVRAGPTQESLDLKHARDSRSRIEWDLAALLRRLHRFRQSVVDWISCNDLRHQHTELSSLKKTLDLRYKRGRAFYSEGRCSDPTNDRREGFSSDLPSHHCNALIWIEEYLADLRKQRRLFRSEMTKLQSSPMSPQPTSPTTTRTRTKISKSIVETITQSPPKLSSATNFRKRRRGKAILEAKPPPRTESEDFEQEDNSLKGMSCAHRNERIGIIEGLSHVHRLHISRLASVRNGLLCQTMNAPNELLDQLRETLNPYIYDNSSGSVIVGEEVYEPFSSLPGDTFDHSLSSGSDASSASVCSSDPSRNEGEEYCGSRYCDDGVKASMPAEEGALGCPIRHDQREREEAAQENNHLDEGVVPKGSSDNDNSQGHGSGSISLTSPRRCEKNGEGTLEEIHVYNEGLTAASTEAESDVSEGSSSCVMSPLPQYLANEGHGLLETLLDSDNDNNSITNNNSENHLPVCSLLDAESRSSGSSWDSTPWRHWDGPWLGRRTSATAATLSQLIRDELLMELTSKTAASLTTNSMTAYLISHLVTERERTELTRLLQQRQQHHHSDCQYLYNQNRNIWGPVEQIEWLNQRPVFKCRMNVNFDGHRISKHPLSSSSHLKKAAEYLNIRSGDQVEVLVRQSGGWAFGICRQLNCNQATTERMGWFPEWLTHRPFCEPITVSDATTKTLQSHFHPTLGHVRSPIINVNPVCTSPSLQSCHLPKKARRQKILRHFRTSKLENNLEIYNEHKKDIPPLSPTSNCHHIHYDLTSSTVNDLNNNNFFWSSIKSSIQSSFSSKLNHQGRRTNFDQSPRTENEQLIRLFVDQILRSSRCSYG